MANAAVLPVPVCAWPIRSRPASIGGIVFSWIGVGASYPISVIAFMMGADSPRLSNVTVSLSSSCPASSAMTSSGLELYPV